MSTVTTSEFDTVVQAGLKRLDEKFGTTFVNQTIELESLNIASGLHCALGQCFGSYGKGVDVLQLDDEKAIEHGFLLPPMSGPERYGALNEAWKEALLARSV